MSILQQELIYTYLPEIIESQDAEIRPNDGYALTKPVKPLSTHLFKGISHAGIALYKKSSQNFQTANWQGRCLRTFANVLVATGYMVNTIVIIAETIGSIVVGILLNLADALTDSTIASLKNHTIKAFSFSLNCIGTLAVQILLLYNKMPIHHYSVNCLVSESLSSIPVALVSSYFDGSQPYSYFDNESTEENKDISAVISILYDFICNNSFFDFFDSLNRDFGEGTAAEFRNKLDNLTLINFIYAYPKYMGLFNGIQLEKIEFPFLNIGDALAPFFTSLREMAADFVHYTYHPESRGEHLGVHVLDANSKKDNNYVNALQDLIKTAVKKIHSDSTLASYLSETRSYEEGKEAIESFWPQVYVPLARYCQFMELKEKEIRCPESFDNKRLHVANNTRYKELEEAQQLLKTMPENVQQQLVEKILSVREFIPAVPEDLRYHFSVLVKQIDSLAGSLHKGTLLSQITAEDITEELSSQNLFQKAYMDAVNELA